MQHLMAQYVDQGAFPSHVLSYALLAKPIVSAGDCSGFCLDGGSVGFPHGRHSTRTHVTLLSALLIENFSYELKIMDAASSLDPDVLTISEIKNSFLEISLGRGANLTGVVNHGD